MPEECFLYRGSCWQISEPCSTYVQLCVRLLEHGAEDHTLHQFLAHRAMFQMLFERVLALGVRTARRDGSLVDSGSLVGIVARVGHGVEYGLITLEIRRLTVAVKFQKSISWV